MMETGHRTAETPPEAGDFHYPSASFARALASATNAAAQCEGWVRITGESGVGKSALAERLASRLEPAWRAAPITATGATTESLWELLTARLDAGAAIRPDAPRQAAETGPWPDVPAGLRAALRDIAQSRRRLLICIDDAHLAPACWLHALRLLSSLRSAGRPLVQVVLLGLPELKQALRADAARQAQSWIACDIALRPLEAGELESYAARRLEWLGWRHSTGTLSPAVLRVIWHASGGVPRRVNQWAAQMVAQNLALAGSAVAGGAVGNWFGQAMHFWRALRAGGQRRLAGVAGALLGAVLAVCLATSGSATAPTGARAATPAAATFVKAAHQADVTAANQADRTGPPGAHVTGAVDGRATARAATARRPVDVSLVGAVGAHVVRDHVRRTKMAAKRRRVAPARASGARGQPLRPPPENRLATSAPTRTEPPTGAGVDMPVQEAEAKRAGASAPTPILAHASAAPGSQNDSIFSTAEAPDAVGALPSQPEPPSEVASAAILSPEQGGMPKERVPAANTNGIVLRTPTPIQQARSLYESALAQVRDGHLSHAADDLERSLALDPANHFARLALVSLDVDGKAYPRAERLLRDGLKLSPGEATLALPLARVVAERQAWHEALDILEQIRPDGAVQAEVLGFKAVLYQQLGRSDAAVHAYRLALALEPGNATWWVGLGMALDGLKQTDAARDAYATARQIGGLSVALRAVTENRLAQMSEQGGHRAIAADMAR